MRGLFELCGNFRGAKRAWMQLRLYASHTRTKQSFNRRSEVICKINTIRSPMKRCIAFYYIRNTCFSSQPCTPHAFSSPPYTILCTQYTTDQLQHRRLTANKMSDTKQSTNIALQLCFGIVGLIGVLVTLAGLHYTDSLGCVLCRRWRRRQHAEGT
jgi:hypothetical protein